MKLLRSSFRCLLAVRHVADLAYANLYCANLYFANLAFANLRHATFHAGSSLLIRLSLLVFSAIPVPFAVAAGHFLFETLPAAALDPASKPAKHLDRIKKEPTTASAKLIVIDADALRGDRIQISLDAGKVLTYLKTRSDTSSNGTMTWYGHLPDRQGTAILVLNKGVVTGSIRDHGALYKIQFAGDGQHVLIEADSAGLPPDHPPHSQPDAAQRARLRERMTSDRIRSSTLQVDKASTGAASADSPAAPHKSHSH